MVDPGRTIDWGKTSADYARHRPGPPPSFYRMLHELGVGLPGQRVLDLGTGTGVVARELAALGCRVSGIDISPQQIAQAAALARAAGLEADFRVAPAEEPPFPDDAFDVVTANQCWLYFDPERAIPRILRVLAPGGMLAVSHFSWLPRLDPVARASEEVVLRHNPAWRGADWEGRIPAAPKWSPEGFQIKGMFFYDEAIPFNRESWRGRIRACRGVGAALGDAEVAAFDAEHGPRLRAIAPEEFTVLHRISAHVFQPVAP